MDVETPPVAVEFVTTSLTSQNLGEKLGWTTREQALPVEREFVRAIPNVEWCDLASHGYMVIDVTAERVIGEWWFVDTILQRTDGQRLAAAWRVDHGTPKLHPVIAGAAAAEGSA